MCLYKKSFFFILLVTILGVNSLNARINPKTNWLKIDSLVKLSEELRQSNLDSSLFLIESAEKMIQNPWDTSIVQNLFYFKGKLLLSSGDYQNSIRYFLKSLKVLEQSPNNFDSYRETKANIYQHLASVYYYTDSYEKADYYLNKCISLNQEVDRSGARSVGCYNIKALIFYDKDELDSALFYFTNLLNINEALRAEGLTKEENLSGNYANIAMVYSDLNQHEKALDFFSKGLEYYKANNDYLPLSWIYGRISNEYIILENKEKAFHYLTLAKEAAELSASLQTQVDLAKSMVDYCITFNEVDLLKDALKEQLRLNDSLVQSKINKNIHELEAKYQLNEKEAALALSKENSARLSAENKIQRTFLFSAIIGLGILIVALFFVYRFYLQRKKIDQMELQIKDTKLDELMSNYESAALSAMLEGQEKERGRIAQDLHDRLGGTLAALKLALRKPENKVDPEDLLIVDEAVSEVRAIAHNLSSGLLEKYGLNEALQQLFQSIERSGGIKFQMYLHPSVTGLGQNVALELYRMVQEMVSNTIKHANATEINLQTNLVDDIFNLIFEDNGAGFDVQKVKNGIGLFNLQKRAENINATLTIDSKPGRGTIVIIELKIKK